MSNLWLSPSLNECGFNQLRFCEVFFEGNIDLEERREDLVVEFLALFPLSFASVGFLINGLLGQNRVRKSSGWSREMLEILAGLACDSLYLFQVSLPVLHGSTPVAGRCPWVVPTWLF